MDQPLRPPGRILQPLGRIAAPGTLEQLRSPAPVSRARLEETPAWLVLAIIADVLEHSVPGKQAFDALVAELYNNLQPQPSVSLRFLGAPFRGRLCTQAGAQLSVDMRQFIRQRQASLLSSQGGVSYKYVAGPSGAPQELALEVTAFGIRVGDARYLPFVCGRLLPANTERLSPARGQQLACLLNWRLYNTSIEPVVYVLYEALKQLQDKAALRYSGDPQMFGLLEELFQRGGCMRQFKHFISGVNCVLPRGDPGVIVVHLLNNKIIVGEEYVELAYNFSAVVECLVANAGMLFHDQQSELPRVYCEFQRRFLEELRGGRGEIEVCRLSKAELLAQRPASEASSASQSAEQYDEQQLDEVLQTLTCDYVVEPEAVLLVFDTQYYAEQYLERLDCLAGLGDAYAGRSVLVAGELAGVPALRDACLGAVTRAGTARSVAPAP